MSLRYACVKSKILSQKQIQISKNPKITAKTTKEKEGRDQVLICPSTLFYNLCQSGQSAKVNARFYSFYVLREQLENQK